MTTRRRPERRAGSALAALVAACVTALVVLLPAAPASAHASLVATDPVDGTVLEETPEEVTLTFSEPVLLTAQQITVYDADGEAVESSATAAGEEVTIDLGGADLADGTYVVGWYVLSADGHPVSGSLSFSVGAPSGDVAAPPPPPESSRLVDAVQGALHALTYVGLLLAAGLAAFVALVLPLRYSGTQVRGRVERVARAAAGVSITSAILLVPVAAIYAQGLELPDLVSAFDPALVTNELAFSSLLVVGLGAVAGLLTDTAPGPRRRAALLAASATAVAAPALVGHTRAYQPELLLLPTDVLHAAAGSIWLGGLVGLVLTLDAIAGREQLAAATLTRFSVLAAGLLAAVTVTGTLLAWRILNSWSGFVETTYGLLLLTKIGIALVVVAIAAWNRFRLLPQIRSASGFRHQAATAGLVRRTVAAEAMLLVALLGVTGFLVNQSPRPAPVEVPAGQTGVQAGTLGELSVLAVMSPREQGPNTVLIQLQDETGEPVEPPRPPVAELRSDDVDLGRVPVSSTDAGTWRAYVLIPQPGVWELQVSVRESKFENPVTTVQFEVS